MPSIADLLAVRRVLVSDGATGTFLQSMGLEAGACTEQWNLTHREQVQQVPRAYLEAGSDLVLTNTFGLHPARLRRFGLDGRLDELAATAVRLARDARAAAGKPEAVVALSIGPAGELLAPLGALAASEAAEGFARVASAGRAAGADACVVETFSDTAEAVLAVQAARAAGFFVMATMSFDPAADGYRTMMGVAPAEAARALREAGADMVGANCGSVEMADMPRIAEAMTAASGLPVIVQANAGRPRLVKGVTEFPQVPADFAAHVRQVIAAGAVIIGGCCGTTPEHIRAIRRSVGAVLAAG